MKISKINLTNGVNIQYKEGTADRQLALARDDFDTLTNEQIEAIIDDAATKAGCIIAVKIFSRDPLDYAVLSTTNRADVDNFLKNHIKD